MLALRAPGGVAGVGLRWSIDSAAGISYGVRLADLAAQQNFWGGRSLSPGRRQASLASARPANRPEGVSVAEDYRVRVGWRNHPKRKKLMRMLGPDAVLAVHDLWEFCAESRTDGDLGGLGAEDLALAADYVFDPIEWVEALVEVGLLVGGPGAYRVHDREAHQPSRGGRCG